MRVNVVKNGCEKLDGSQSSVVTQVQHLYIYLFVGIYINIITS